MNTTASVALRGAVTTTDVLRRPGGLAAMAAKYLAILTINLRNQLAYVGDVAMRNLFLAIILYIFLRLWRVTFASQGRTTIGGFTVEQMIWYLVFTEAIVMSRSNVSQTIDGEVRTGDIAYTLVRPFGYAGYHLASYLAERLVRFTTTLVTGVALALLYVGPIAIHPAHVALALPALALSLAIDFAITFGIGLLAFWIEDTSSVSLIYSRVAMLLGGTLLPLELFPAPLDAIAAALPFAALVYGPARIALGASAENVQRLFTNELAMLVGAGVVLWLLYRAGMRRIDVNGG